MRLKLSAMRAVALLSVTVGLAGCTRVESSIASVQDSLTGTYTRFGPQWGGMRPAMPTESLTVQRIRGRAEVPETLRPEPGDVWPGEEAPRATLANPEEALRGIRPVDEPRRPRGSGGFENAPGAAPPVVSPIFEAPTPPPRANRTDGATAPGQVFPATQGSSPTVGTGGSGRVQSTVSPDGSGIAIRDGATTTLIGPGGNVQQVPTPR